MELLQYLRLFHSLEDKDYELLTNEFQEKSIRKGAYLAEPGQVLNVLYFVRSGIQMSYFESDLKQHVIAFTYPPNLCTIPESFMMQKPSAYYLKCLSDSQFSMIGYDALQSLFEKSQSIERLFRKITEAVLAGMINRHIELHVMSIEERFKTFAERSPQLLQKIPHKYIASYLGIDSTNFSKLFNSVKI